jgi:hypothetical protein
MHNRKDKWFGVALLVSAIIGLSVAHTAWAQDKKPNIVMLMTDDTGWGDFGAYSGGGWAWAIRRRTLIRLPAAGVGAGAARGDRLGECRKHPGSLRAFVGRVRRANSLRWPTPSASLICGNALHSRYKAPPPCLDRTRDEAFVFLRWRHGPIASS